MLPVLYLTPFGGQAQEALERERDEDVLRERDDGRQGVLPRSEAGDEAKFLLDAVQSSSTGFRLDMGRVTGAAQKAAELEPDMVSNT